METQHPLAALAVFRVQKYETWREYLVGSPAPAGALTRAREDDRQVCTQLAFCVDGRRRQLPGAGTRAYVGVTGMFRNVCRCPVGFLRDEICVGSPRGVSRRDDLDALQEARREYDEVEHQVRLEGVNRKEHDDRLGELESSDEEESPYEVLSLENVRKMGKRPGAPKWTVSPSKDLREYLQHPEKAGEHGLANAIWDIMRKTDRQGSAYLKEEWKKKHKKEK